MNQKNNHGTEFVAGGAATGAWVSLNFGGMGLAYSGTAVGLGLTPLTMAGAVTGAATYGVFRAVVEGDPSSLSAAALGGLGGAGVSLSVGGMGLAFKGTAISLGIAPLTSAGMVVGFAVYGILKMMGDATSKESAQQIFSRMEEKISWQESYQEALLDLSLSALDRKLFGDAVEQKFAQWEIEDELQTLRENLGHSAFNSQALQPILATVKADFQSQFGAELDFLEFEDVSCRFESAVPDMRNKSPQSPLEINKECSAEASQALNVQPQFQWQCTHKIQSRCVKPQSFSITSAGKVLAIGHDNGNVQLWNLQHKRYQYRFFGESKNVEALTFCFQDQFLVSGGCDRKLTVWNPEQKKFEKTLLENNHNYSHDGVVRSITFSDPHKLLISGGDDGMIRCWSVPFGKPTKSWQAHEHSVRCLILDATGQSLMSGGQDQRIKIWDVQTGTCHRTIDTDGGTIFSVSIASEHLLVTAHEDKTVKIWNWHTGDLIHTLQAHEHPVLAVIGSPDSQVLVTASVHEVKLWSLSSGDLLQTLSGAIFPVIFSPDGSLLITGSVEGAVKLWEYQVADKQAEADLLVGGTWWEILQVSRTATPEDVKVAYRRLARQYHPDVNSSVEAEAWMQAINHAKKQFDQQQIM